MRVDVRQILIAHDHLDHAGAAAALARHLSVPIVGPHRDDAFLIETLADAGVRYGIGGAAALEPARWRDDGDEVRVGE